MARYKVTADPLMAAMYFQADSEDEAWEKAKKLALRNGMTLYNGKVEKVPTEADKDARIAALEAENKLLLAALQTANSYFPKVELLIVEGAPLPAPTIRALLNGGGK